MKLSASANPIAEVGSFWRGETLVGLLNAAAIVMVVLWLQVLVLTLHQTLQILREHEHQASQYKPDLQALKAGSDMVMMPANLDEAFRGVCEGVKAGELSMEELDAKVRRVLSLKYERGYLS